MKKKCRMLIKVLVALCGITLTISVMLLTPLWGSAILISFITGLCCWELCVPTKAVRAKPPILFGTVIAVLIPWFWCLQIQSAALPLTVLLFLAAVFLYDAVTGKIAGAEKIAYLTLAAVVFPAMFSLLLPVLATEGGKAYILLPFTAAWSADTGAQLFGRTIGKHKLAPKISPNKTVEGLCGGLLFGVLGTAIYALVLHCMHREPPVVGMLVFGLFAAGFATVGDLFFSYIKREFGIKDFSSMMPEHGGIMDRFDSIVFVIPLFYFFMRLISVA